MLRVVGDDRDAANHGAGAVERGRHDEVHRAPAQGGVGDLELDVDVLAGQHARGSGLDRGKGLVSHDVAQGHSDQILRLLSEARRVVLVRPDETEGGVVARDHRGRRVDDDLQLLARPPAVQFGALARRDVLAGAAPLCCSSGGIPVEHEPGLDVAYGAVGTDDPERDLEAAAPLGRGARRAANLLAIVGMYRRVEAGKVERDTAFLPEEAVHLVGETQDATGAVRADRRLPASDVGCGLRVGEHAFAISQRPLRVPHVADVGHERYEAAYVPVCVSIGEIGRSHRAVVPLAEADLRLIRDVLASQRSRHVRFDRRPCDFPHDVANGAVANRIGRDTEPAAVRFVGPQVAALGVDVRQERRHRVGDQLRSPRVLRSRAPRWFAHGGRLCAVPAATSKRSAGANNLHTRRPRCDPGPIRTGDLRFRKPLLYPPELRGLRGEI